VFAAFCVYTHSCPFSWLVFCEAAGVMILERYEGAVFRTSCALANPQEKGDHEHFPVHDRNGNSLVFCLSNVSSFCLFHFFHPPSAYRTRTCRLNDDRGGLIEGALAVNTQARAFNRRNLIVDPRVRSRRPPPLWLCVLLNTLAFPLPCPDQVLFLGHGAIVLAYITMPMRLCLPSGSIRCRMTTLTA